jgi:hypothetical protein
MDILPFIELRTGKGTHSLSGILNIDAKRSIINPRFNKIPSGVLDGCPSV